MNEPQQLVLSFAGASALWASIHFLSLQMHYRTYQPQLFCAPPANSEMLLPIPDPPSLDPDAPPLDFSLD